MGTPTLTSLDDDRSIESDALLDESVMNGTSCQEWWDVICIFVHTSITNNNELVALFDLVDGCISDIN